MSVSDITSIILASAVPLILIGGLVHRIALRKGIGSQYIRYTVVGASIPVMGVLALNGVPVLFGTGSFFGALVGFALAGILNGSD